MDIPSITTSWVITERQIGVPHSSAKAAVASVVDGRDEPTRSTPSAPKVRTQVASSVAQTVRQNSCGLKPQVKAEKKSTTLGVRFRTEELLIVQTKAQLANCPTNSYIRAAALGSDYKQPLHPELKTILLNLNRELTAHGRNLNQIAKQLNAGRVTGDESIAMLDANRVPLVRALYAVKNALVQSEPYPG